MSAWHGKIEIKTKTFLKGISQDEFSENGVGRRSNKSFRMRTMTISEGSPTNSPRRVVPYFYRRFDSIFSRTKSFVLEKMFSHTWLRQV